MGRRIYLRFKRFGIVCEFVENGATCGSFDGKNYWFESIYIGPYYLEEYPKMMRLTRGPVLGDPAGVTTSKWAIFKRDSGSLEINFKDRRFVLRLNDKRSLFRIGSSLSLDGDQIGCFWKPKGLWPFRQYLEIEQGSDLADWERILLAFFSSYLPKEAAEYVEGLTAGG